MKLSNLTMASVALATSLALTGCGGGSSSEPAKVATANAATTIGTANGAAVIGAVTGKQYAFASGVTAFGTTTATTVTFSAGTTSPNFSITSSQGTASGALSFGSCIFTVSVSTYPAGSALAVGAKITVNPCNLQLTTSGLNADGSNLSANSVLVLGTVNSTPIALAITIDADGVVRSGGTVIGNTTVGATGASGSTK